MPSRAVARAARPCRRATKASRSGGSREARRGERNGRRRGARPEHRRGRRPRRRRRPTRAAERVRRERRTTRGSPSPQEGRVAVARAAPRRASATHAARSSVGAACRTSGAAVSSGMPAHHVGRATGWAREGALGRVVGIGVATLLGRGGHSRGWPRGRRRSCGPRTTGFASSSPRGATTPTPHGPASGPLARSLPAPLVATARAAARRTRLVHGGAGAARAPPRTARRDTLRAIGSAAAPAAMSPRPRGTATRRTAARCRVHGRRGRAPRSDATARRRSGPSARLDRRLAAAATSTPRCVA